MIELMILTLWVMTGLAIAGLLTARSEPNLAWAPLAAVFGPLWIFIAVDQRVHARRTALAVTPVEMPPVHRQREDSRQVDARDRPGPYLRELSHTAGVHGPASPRREPETASALAEPMGASR